MEKATAKKKTKILSKEDIKLKFMEYVQEYGKLPVSIFSFTKSLKAKESDFFDHFNSFGAVERAIWKDWMEEVVSTLENDKAYVSYSVREKMLAFFFTWLEVLKTNRSYVLMKWENLDKKEMNPDFLISLKESFRHYVEDLLLEGKDTKEVADRPFSNQYFKGFWIHFLFVTHYWVSDDSTDFEQTDAIIEKSIHFAFDLVGKGPLDSFLDLAKFLYQNNKVV